MLTYALSRPQVFSEVNITFSVGGEHFLGEPIVYSYMEDRIFEHSRNVTIKLHHRIGKFVKLKFAFASRWIMISEITFDSGEWRFSSLPRVGESLAESRVFHRR